MGPHKTFRQDATRPGGFHTYLLTIDSRPREVTVGIIWEATRLPWTNGPPVISPQSSGSNERP